jgi:hypothetical protein
MVAVAASRSRPSIVPKANLPTLASIDVGCLRREHVPRTPLYARFSRLESAAGHSGPYPDGTFTCENIASFRTHHAPISRTHRNRSLGLEPFQLGPDIGALCLIEFRRPR